MVRAGHGPPTIVISSLAATLGFEQPSAIVQAPTGSPPQGWVAPQVPPQPAPATASTSATVAKVRGVTRADLSARGGLSKQPARKWDARLCYRRGHGTAGARSREISRACGRRRVRQPGRVPLQLRAQL